MTNKSTKRALLTSFMALFLCFTMLLGTTFAWFTDSVTSANNLIVAGNLDVELYNGLDTSADTVDANTELFEEVELWEPGAVAYENLAVANNGNLALKYQLAINVTEATQTADGNTLADVLKVAVIPGGFTGTREDAKELSYNYSLSTFAKVGELAVGAEPDVYGIVIYWEPTANDNYYNMNAGQDPLEVTLGVNLFATQLSAELEKDSFGPEYDAGAEMPNIDSSAANVKNDGSATMETSAAPSANTKKTTIKAPAGAFDPADKVEVKVETANSLFDVTAAGNVVASLDITITVNDEETSADLTDNKVFTVTTYISKGLSEVSVDYTGTDGKDEPTFVSYEAETGKLVFTTNHFSNYDVSGKALAYDAENDSALVTIDQIVAARNDENKTVLIPEANQAVIEEEIKKLPEEKREEAIAATYAASIGENYYASLVDALTKAAEGDTVVILNDLIIAGDWDSRYTGGKTANVITIDGNGKTLKFTGTIDDKNHFTVFRFENTATVKDLTFDLSEAKGVSNRVRAISAKADLTVENCTFIGNSEITNDRAIIFGEGSGTAISELDVSVIGCEFIDWRKGISDNENAQDAKSVVVNNNSFKNAGVAVSAFESVTFTGNTMDNGSVNITSYTDLDKLKIVAENNKLDETKDNFLGKTAYVATVKSLDSALGKVYDVVLNSDLTFNASETNANSGYGATGIRVQGSILDGNNHTLTVNGAWSTWDCAVNTVGGTIKDLTINSAMRGIFMGGATDDVYIDGVTIDGTVYTFNSDGGNKNYGVYISNTTLNGWTSYSNVHKEVIFTDCKFGEGQGYSFCRPYNASVFENCVFEEGFEFDTSNTSDIVFKNCYYGDTLITAENAVSLCDGETVFFYNGLNDITIQ